MTWGAASNMDRVHARVTLALRPGARCAYLVLAVCLQGVGCEAAPSSLARDPQTVVVARAVDALVLDPARATDSESFDINSLLYDGLVRWRPGTFQVEPGLATHWQVSDDGLLWTFFLRPGLRFSDGSPLDAAAVVASVERQQNPSHAFARADFRYARDLYGDVAAVRALDAITVQFALRRRFMPFLASLAMPAAAVVSPAAIAMHQGDIASGSPSSGPYRLVYWERGTRVVLERNPHYWGVPARVARLVFTVVPDARQRVIALESGAADIALAMLPQERSFVALHPNLRLHEVAGNNVVYLAMNTTHAPLDDRKVRRAIAAAVDRQTLVVRGFHGLAQPAYGAVPPYAVAAEVADAATATSRDLAAPSVDAAFAPELARAEVAAADARGVFFRGRALRLFVPSDARAYLPDPLSVAELLAAQLGEVGIAVTIEALPYSQLRAALERGEHDLCLLGWTSDNGDPDNVYTRLFSSAFAMPPHPQNIAFWRDPALDTLLVAAQTAAPTARQPLYETVANRLAHDAPWVPLVHSQYVVAARAHVRNVVLSPNGHVAYALLALGAP